MVLTLILYACQFSPCMYAVPSPSSVTVASDPSFIESTGLHVIVLCTVKLSPLVTESEVSLITVSARLIHNGTRELLPTMSARQGTTYTFSALIQSFQRIDNGEYVCTATVSPHSSSQLIIGNGTRTGMADISLGMRIPCTTYYDNSIDNTHFYHG